MLRSARLCDTATRAEVVLADDFLCPQLCQRLLAAALAAPEEQDYRHLELETPSSRPRTSWWRG